MTRWIVCLVLLASGSGWARPPRLTVFITVDSMGADILQRMRPRLKGGLATILNQGAVFTDVRYEYAETVTASGHATLATGANPWRHGVVGNRVLNRATQKLESVYTDPAHPTLEAPLAVEDSSPENLLAETLGDRIRMFTQQRGKVFGIAEKARAALPLAGKLGQACWFNAMVGKFVTGTYYAKETPLWLKAFNDKKLPDSFFGKEWTLSGKPDDYVGEDDRPFEADVNGLGRTFPHPLNANLTSPGPEYYSVLTSSPMMNDMVILLAKSVIASEQLGRDDVPDFLGVSFGATDKTYHMFGPYSWEAQDQMLRLDRALADLISTAEKAAGGRQNLLVVLTADHGGAALPEEWAAQGLPGQRFDPYTWFPQLNKDLAAKFGAADLVLSYEEMDIYLNNKVITDKKLDGAAIRRFVAHWISQKPPIAFAVARDDLDKANSEAGLMDSVRKSFHPERSGDVLFVSKPYRVSSDYPTGTSHGQPYAYDNQIAVGFLGHGIKPATYPERVSTVDVAPTVASLLEMGMPASAEGKALPLR
jgi:predicted AlkP superfamily pyrophosphatase or phosphodiesterase